MDQRGHDAEVGGAGWGFGCVGFEGGWREGVSGGVQFGGCGGAGGAPLAGMGLRRRRSIRRGMFGRRRIWGRLSEAAGVVAAHGVLLLELKK